MTKGNESPSAGAKPRWIKVRKVGQYFTLWCEPCGGDGAHLNTRAEADELMAEHLRLYHPAFSREA